MKLRHGLVGAFMLLTRLPVARWSGTTAEAGPWAWPVVGAVVGLIGGCVFAVLRSAGCPAALAALWTLAVQVLVTGGLHEDGLADTADGFGGGRTAARKLEIMRDSRIGSYGALALLFSVALRGTAVATLERPGAVLCALVVAGTLGRAAMLLPAWLTPPARTDGLAAGLPRLGGGAVVAGWGVAMVMALLLEPVGAGLASVATAGVVALGMARLSLHQIGGHTGDVLGATELAVECVVLSVLAAVA